MDPARLVTEIQGVRAAFPDLDFLAPQGVLRVPVDHDGAVRLRLQVPGQTYFHLHAIEVAADDENWRSHASWRSSSAWTGTTGTAAAALFEADGHHDAAFHTELETAPWVEVSFDRPVGIRHVTVHNVTSPNASRARGMQMLVAGADGSWQKVYDGRARVQLLRSVLAQQALYRLHPVSDETADLAAIVVAMGVGAYRRASNALQHPPWLTHPPRGVCVIPVQPPVRRSRGATNPALLAPVDVGEVFVAVVKRRHVLRPTDLRPRLAAGLALLQARLVQRGALLAVGAARARPEAGSTRHRCAPATSPRSCRRQG